MCLIFPHLNVTILLPARIFWAFEKALFKLKMWHQINPDLRFSLMLMIRAAELRHFPHSRAQTQGPHSHILMTGGSEGFFWVWHFGQKGFFWVYERHRDFFGSRKQRRDFLGVLYFSSAQIKNNISASYSVVFDQNQSWSWHVLAFQKINNKICWCKNSEGFFWVC